MAVPSLGNQGGAAPLRFYLDENIFDQRPGNKFLWCLGGRGGTERSSLPAGSSEIPGQERSFNDGVVVTNMSSEEMPSQVPAPVFSHWCRTQLLTSEG